MMRVMEEPAPIGPDRTAQMLALYDDALPQVYGYLVRRCPTTALAEDLTGETFVAAMDACRRGTVARPSIGWLVTIGRNKLVDHWRREAREASKLRLAATTPEDPDTAWESELEEAAVLRTLAALGPHHRAALTLRYLDGLPVPEVADHLGRTVHATEALLMRAKAAFRVRYPEPPTAQQPGGTDA
jgi:RNA polymerase sigma-70 factor (ECF subfamily)